MKKIILIVISLLITNSAFALETPMKELFKYFKNGELIKISSYTVPGWPNQYMSIKDGSYKKNPIQVDAFITFPKKDEGPFPVLIFAHARGTRSTSSNQKAVSHFSTYIDAFKALEYLSKDPKVNIKKVGITGWSRGGMISLMTSEKRLRDALVSKDLYFAAAQPRSLDCWSAEMFRNPQPIKETKTWMVLGGADDYTRAGPCVELGEKIKANGGDIKIEVKKGWYHGFLGNYPKEKSKDAQIY